MDRAGLTAWVRALPQAVERNGAVFLCDPQWTPAERAQVESQMGKAAVAAEEGVAAGWLCIRTGGSGGEVKFARHDEVTLGAAVEGFCQHFGLARVNAVDVLPAYHVSGLMARMRCAATGGSHVAWEWKKLEAGEVPAGRDGDWVISLVPTQLHRLLRRPATCDWLRSFAVILVGGGPVWPELTDEAAALGLRLALSYGMTETAAMVAALRPEEFLAGARSSGPALPHARVTIETAEQVVRIAGESVYRGYWPQGHERRDFWPGDVGRIDERGHLHILGRLDAAIITGGKKVRPEDVELALRASGEFSDVAVIGLPDPEWGEAVVACYPAAQIRKPDTVRAAAALAAFQRPKRYVALPEWPRNAQGKVNRPALRAAVLATPS